MASLNDQQRVGGLQGVSRGTLVCVSGDGATEPEEVWNVSDDSAIPGAGVYSLRDLRVSCVSSDGDRGVGPDGDGEGQFSWEGCRRLWCAWTVRSVSWTYRTSS